MSERPPFRFVWLFSGGTLATLAFGVVAFPEWGAKAVWAAFHVGILFIATKNRAFRAVVSFYRYGRATCEMARVPVRTGEHLRGIVQTALTHSALLGSTLQVRLSCIHIGTAPSLRTGSSAGESGRYAPEESYLWADEKHVCAAASPAGAGLAVPVRFEIPENQPCTRLGPPPERILWRLEVRAVLRRGTFLARFHIPVFDAEPAFPERLDRLEAFDETRASCEAGHEATESTSASVTIEPTAGGGTCFRFGVLRPAGPATMLKALAQKAFYNSTVTIEQHRIRVRWRTLFDRRTVSFRCEELQGIEVNSNASLFAIQLLRDVRDRPDLLEKQRRRIERSEKLHERLVKAGFHDTGDPRSVEEHLTQAGLLESRVQAAYLWSKQEAERVAALMRAAARVQGMPE